MTEPFSFFVASAPVIGDNDLCSPFPADKPTNDTEGCSLNILLTLDRSYLSPMHILLFSLLVNNPGETFDVFIISGDLTQDDLAPASRLCARFSSRLHLISADDTLFEHAPVIRYYSKAMYYRLLAAALLPESLDRVLYLDPDILVIGLIRPLYDLPMHDMPYAAAIHRGLVDLSTPVNRIRLSTFDAEGYFNSGVLLMNLPAVRSTVSAQDIFRFAQENRHLLILPDQDILNSLYGEKILPVEETIWNYDARKYREYLVASQGELNMQHVMEKTAILHFCGKNKPWKKNGHGRFVSLYRHYMSLAHRYMNI